MPKYRKLHCKTTESFAVAEMPDWFTRYMWVTLMLILDREGKGVDNCSWIKSRLVPLIPDVTDTMIDDAMNWYAEHGMIQRYEVAGRNYFKQINFSTYQGSTIKESDSIYPDPISSETVTPTPGPSLTPRKETIGALREGGGNSPELVESKSGVSQELVKSKSSTDSDSDADTNAESDADARADARASTSAPEKPVKKTELFDELVFELERVIGIPQGSAVVPIVNDFIGIGALPEDVREAANWYRTQNKTIKYASSLVGPVRTAVLKRVQSTALGPPGETNIKPTPVPSQPFGKNLSAPSAGGGRVAFGNSKSGVDELLEELNHG